MKTIKIIIILTVSIVAVVALLFQIYSLRADDAAILDALEKMESRIEAKIEQRIQFAKSRAEFKIDQIETIPTNELLKMILKQLDIKIESIPATTQDRYKLTPKEQEP